MIKELMSEQIPFAIMVSRKSVKRGHQLNAPEYTLVIAKKDRERIKKVTKLTTFGDRVNRRVLCHTLRPTQIEEFKAVHNNLTRVLRCEHGRVYSFMSFKKYYRK